MKIIKIQKKKQKINYLFLKKILFKVKNFLKFFQEIKKSFDLIKFTTSLLKETYDEILQENSNNNQNFHIFHENTDNLKLKTHNFENLQNLIYSLNSDFISIFIIEHPENFLISDSIIPILTDSLELEDNKISTFKINCENNKIDYENFLIEELKHKARKRIHSDISQTFITDYTTKSLKEKIKKTENYISKNKLINVDGINNNSEKIKIKTKKFYNENDNILENRNISLNNSNSSFINKSNIKEKLLDKSNNLKNTAINNPNKIGFEKNLFHSFTVQNLQNKSDFQDKENSTLILSNLNTDSNKNIYFNKDEIKDNKLLISDINDNSNSFLKIKNEKKKSSENINENYISNNQLEVSEIIQTSMDNSLNNLDEQNINLNYGNSNLFASNINNDIINSNFVNLDSNTITNNINENSNISIANKIYYSRQGNNQYSNNKSTNLSYISNNSINFNNFKNLSNFKLNLFESNSLKSNKSIISTNDFVKNENKSDKNDILSFKKNNSTENSYSLNDLHEKGSSVGYNPNQFKQNLFKNNNNIIRAGINGKLNFNLSNVQKVKKQKSNKKIIKNKCQVIDKLFDKLSEKLESGTSKTIKKLNDKNNLSSINQQNYEILNKCNGVINSYSDMEIKNKFNSEKNLFNNLKIDTLGSSSSYLLRDAYDQSNKINNNEIKLNYNLKNILNNNFYPDKLDKPKFSKRIENRHPNIENNSNINKELNNNAETNDKSPKSYDLLKLNIKEKINKNIFNLENKINIQGQENINNSNQQEINFKRTLDDQKNNNINKKIRVRICKSKSKDNSTNNENTIIDQEILADKAASDDDILAYSTPTKLIPNLRKKSKDAESMNQISLNNSTINFLNLVKQIKK